MRYPAALILSLLLAAGCYTGGIENTGGTRLALVEYELERSDDWVERYSYDSEYKLIEIEDTHGLGQRYQVEYSNGRLVQFTTYRKDENEAIFRDSVLYDASGRIEKIYQYSANAGEDLPLDWILEFYYDDSGVLRSKKTFFIRSQTYTSIENYYWDGPNVERAEFIANGELYYEYFYTYDDKVNYRKGHPLYLSDPVSWGENNVTVANWNDYYGNLDIICRPCESEYVYNLDDRPVRITTNWGSQTTLWYY